MDLPDPRITNDDPRISYDKINDRYLFEDPATSESLEYNTTLNKWIPTDLTSELTDAQREIQEKKRQKLQELKEKQAPKRQNTAVYVSGLPLDCDVWELKQVFEKCGVISEDLLTNKPKIKMYYDGDKFKGDALVVFMKPESVELAIQLLDDTPLRPHRKNISVQRAEFKEKSEKEGHKRQLTEEDRKVIKKRLKLLNEKVDGWDGNDEGEVNPKWARSMVLRRVFTLEEVQDPEEKEDIIEDMKEGCAEFGEVETVVLFDEEEDGVVLVRFKNSEDCAKCIEKMNGRFFGGRKLIATLYNGESFRRSGQKKENTRPALDDADDQERLADYINNVGEDQ